MMAGTASVISRVLGEGDIGRVRRITTDAALLGTMLAAAFSVIGLLSLDNVFRLLGASDDTYRRIVSLDRTRQFRNGGHGDGN